MNLEQLANELRDAYNGADEGEKVTMIHLFGIRFAEQIQHHSIRDIVALSGISETYATEVGKGVRLARFVEIR